MQNSLGPQGVCGAQHIPFVRDVLSGAAASSVAEARLAREFIGKEVHAYAPAYSDTDIEELATLADHVVFNSVPQLERFQPQLRSAVQHIQLGLRINPEHRETEVALYDPCASGSRLGVPRHAMVGNVLDDLNGLHFHNLCEKDSDALERTLESVERNFASFIERVQWVNFGGGHLITRPGYDVERLVRVIHNFRNRWRKEVYLEPGEAIGLNTGWLVTTVLDVVDYGQRNCDPRHIRDGSYAGRSRKCPTGRESWVARRPASSRTRCDWVASRASRATSSGTIPSIGR